YKYLSEFPKPVVLCTFERNDPGFPAVHVDETAAAADAVEYLISRGHRRIGLIAGAHFSFSKLRAKSYVQVLEKHDIEAQEAWQVVVPSYTPEAGRQGMQALLARDRSLSAIFAITDELAIGAIRALHEAKIRIPEDVSVFGFDDIDISGFMEPALTTIHQPIIEMGERTAELMCELIDEGKGPRPPVVLPHRLVERESVANR
ncbi:MAG: substrate-binding domain-containing protein, partial [Spirochaetaceae bacterium]|nr:substrate-binding domain-containing protein [Spirochaetaceae bacterium]